MYNILFIPWIRDQAEEQYQNCSSLKDKYNSKMKGLTMRIVTYLGTFRPNHDRLGKDTKKTAIRKLYREDVFLRNMLAPDTSIYIRGHCDWKNPATISPKKDGKNPLSFIEACNRLVGTGLQESYRGKIKLYNCSSAKAPKAESSFAVLCTNYLRDEHGLNQCIYYGYDEDVSSGYMYHDFDEKGANWHKAVMLESDEPEKSLVGSDRASDVRRLIWRPGWPTD